MILPIVSAIAREVMATVPSEHKEAALALGATRWEMIRMAVLPYSRPGITGGAMLGLGRALGETIAVVLVIGNAPDDRLAPVQPGLLAGRGDRQRVRRGGGDPESTARRCSRPGWSCSCSPWSSTSLARRFIARGQRGQRGTGGTGVTVATGARPETTA